MENLNNIMYKEKSSLKITEFTETLSFDSAFPDKIYKTVKGFALLGQFDKDRFIDFLNLIAIDYFASYNARGYNPKMSEAEIDINRRINYFLKNNSAHALSSIKILYDNSLAYVLYRIQEKLKNNIAAGSNIQTIDQKDDFLREHASLKKESVAKKHAAAKKGLVLAGYPDFGEYDDSDVQEVYLENEADKDKYLNHDLHIESVQIQNIRSTEADTRPEVEEVSHDKDSDSVSGIPEGAEYLETTGDWYPAFRELPVIEPEKDADGYPTIEISEADESDKAPELSDEEEIKEIHIETVTPTAQATEPDVVPELSLSLRFWDYISKCDEASEKDEAKINSVYPTVDYLTGKGNREVFRKFITGISTGIYLATEKSSYTTAGQIKSRIRERVKRFFTDRYVNTDRLLDEFYDNCFIAIVSQIKKWEGAGGSELFIIDNFPVYSDSASSEPDRKMPADNSALPKKHRIAEPRKTAVTKTRRRSKTKKEDIIYNIVIGMLSVILAGILGAIFYMHNYV